MNQAQINELMNYQSNASGLIMFYENLLRDIMHQTTDTNIAATIPEALTFGEKIWEKRWDIEYTKQVPTHRI